jgi:acyl-CoA hydrolase
MRSESADGDLGPSEARLWEIVFPDHANHLGTLFGGQALAWMDKAAFIAATRYARRTVVTARSEQVGALNKHGHVTLRQGQLVELIAQVVETGRSSMRVEVELHAEDAHAGTRQLCTRGHFVMIALDEGGQPAAVV